MCADGGVCEGEEGRGPRIPAPREQHRCPGGGGMWGEAATSFTTPTGVAGVAGASPQQLLPVFPRAGRVPSSCPSFPGQSPGSPQGCAEKQDQGPGGQEGWLGPQPDTLGCFLSRGRPGPGPPHSWVPVPGCVLTPPTDLEEEVAQATSERFDLIAGNMSTQGGSTKDTGVIGESGGGLPSCEALRMGQWSPPDISRSIL